MENYDVIEFMIFSLYLIFVFLSVQIWLLWKDVDKNELKVSFASESFFKKNCAYVFSFSVFFMVHKFVEGTSMVSFGFFEMLALASLVLFAHQWYGMLKTCTHKRSMPGELTRFS